MDARTAYEKALEAGHAPSGASEKEIREKGSAVQQGARILMATDATLTYDAARNRIRRVCATKPKRVDDKSEPDLYEESKAERFRREALALKANEKRLLEELENARRLREHAFGLRPAAIAPPGGWQVIRRKSTGKKETPVLFTSDFQVGEVIPAAATRGLNEYNVDIFRKRYRTLIGVTCKLIQEHHGGAEEIVYLRGGDTISGSIHPELADTDECPPPQQCVVAIQEETAGIRHLAETFGRVHVISVPGNHDRITEKPRSKAYDAYSYEPLIQWAIEAQFKDDPRVSFLTDQSGDVLFNVQGYNMLLTHGDRIGSGGGQGFLGPSGPIVRGAKKVKAQFAAEGHHVDLVLIGHYHFPMHVNNDVMCNGCLPGYSEYARGRMRVAPQAPSQMLFFVHPDHGITAVREIDVNSRPRRSRGPHVVT